MSEARPVTIENWQTLIDLKVREDQKIFVASNLYSIAQSKFGDDYEGLWDLFPFGIYEEDTPVGFLMYALNLQHPTHQAYIQRLMVDENFQGKGYGRFGMDWMLDLFREDERIKVVGISYEPDNEVARKLYAGLGFEETGKIVDGETEAMLKIR